MLLLSESARLRGMHVQNDRVLILLLAYQLELFEDWTKCMDDGIVEYGSASYGTASWLLSFIRRNWMKTYTLDWVIFERSKDESDNKWSLFWMNRGDPSSPRVRPRTPVVPAIHYRLTRSTGYLKLFTDDTLVWTEMVCVWRVCSKIASDEGNFILINVSYVYWW